MTPNPATLAEMLRTIAPADVDGLPVYVVFQSTIDERLRLPATTFGYTSANIDLALSPTLEARGEWLGRGICIVVCDDALRRECFEVLAADDHELATTLYEQRLIAVTLHEFGHAMSGQLCADYTERDHYTPDDARNWEESLAACASGPRRAELVLPWTGHAAPFLRAALHATTRAERNGCPRVPRSLLFDGPAYGLSRVESYHHELKTELETYQGTFAGLHDVQPPRGFVELWRSDIHRATYSLLCDKKIAAPLRQLADDMTLFDKQE